MVDLRGLASRLQNVFARRRFEREMEKELRLHLDLEADALRRAGVAPVEAERLARVAFGGVEKTKEEIRDERGARWLELTELRQAFRRLLRAPTFALASITLLALGLGGATVVFGALDVMYLRPPPFPHASQLAFVEVQVPQSMCHERCTRDPTPEELARWQTLLGRDVDGMGTINPTEFSMMGDDGRLLLEGAIVSADVPGMLGFRTALGRSFAQDELDGSHNAILLGHDAWLHDFGGDSAIVGRVLRDETTAYHVIGVMAAESDLGLPFYSYNVPRAQFIVPASTAATSAARSGRTVFRTRDDVSMQAFQAHAAALPTTALYASASTNRVVVTPLRDVFARDYRTTVWLIAAAALVMLAVVSVNFAALVGARLNARTAELTTRVALGASRGALTRMVAIETSLIVAIGGIFGVWLAREVLGLSRLLPPSTIPAGAVPSVDTRVGLFALGTAMIIALALSIVPWLTFSPSMIQQRLRDAFSQGSDRRRIRNILLGVQVALAVTLLGAAGLLTRLFVAAEHRGMGTARRSVLMVQFDRAPRIADDGAARSYDAALRDRLMRVPGVADVALSGVQQRGASIDRTRGPSFARDAVVMTVEGRADGLTASVAPARATDASSNYLQLYGLPLLAGRWFDKSDVASGTPVAILDSVGAARLFPGENPLRRRIKFGNAASTDRWLTIVGVVGSERNPLPGDGTGRPTIYRSTEQFPVAPSSMLIRTTSSTEYDVVPGIRRALTDVDRNLTMASAISVEDALNDRIRPARFHATVIDGFALFVLAVACLGIFAAVSYAVSRRQREIAIKVALGAHAHDVVIDVVAQSVRVVIVGLGAGIIASAAAARLTRAVLYGGSPYDPMVYAGVVIVMLAAAAVAAYLPARRAVGVDPARLMRAE